ncbi:MAG TPA: glycerol-3-phosphate 1-O-acyltransferase PlsY [Terriglobales bacterium]|nr:glycerol-3-phosphate 1-O-acyltransferase PlsY [Terriglobales bacterium]
MIGTYIVVAVVAYLLGSIPFGYILLRLFRGQDVRATGSGNIGATNVARSAPGLGVLTLLLDAGKGFVAVAGTLGFFAYALVHSPAWAVALGAYAGLWAILGHMFPVWLKFKGGKGVATAAGAFALLIPRALLLALAIFLLATLVTRYVSLGSILAGVTLPIGAHFLPPRSAGESLGSVQLTVVVAAASLLIILKHHQNIRRLLAGTEHRFTLKGRSA